MARSERLSQENAETLAAEGLAFLAQDMERLGRFLALSGIAPERIRTAAREPGFLAGVLEYILGDERLVTAFAEERGMAPERVGEARERLATPAA
jgi:hypothetical protein